MAGARCPDNVGDEIERYDICDGATLLGDQWHISERDPVLGVRLSIVNSASRTLIFEVKYDGHEVSRKMGERLG